MDDAEGNGLAVPKDKQRRHVEEPVEGASHSGQLGASIVLTLALAFAGGGGAKLDREKKEAVDLRALEFPLAVEGQLGGAGGGRLHLPVGELKEKLDALPVSEKGAVGVEGLAAVEGAEEAVGGIGAEFHAPLATVAKDIQQAEGGIEQGCRAEGSERGFDLLQKFRVGGHGLAGRWTGRELL